MKLEEAEEGAVEGWTHGHHNLSPQNAKVVNH